MLDPAAPRSELKALTSLRGLAAMAVVLQHFSATAQLNTQAWIPSLVPHGYMAVDFFFVLSGFIMSYTYLAGFQAIGMRAYLPFLWKRVARIFPLGLAVTASILCAGAIAGLFGLEWLFLKVTAPGGLSAMVLVNVLHLQGFLPEYNLNDPSWSVSVELGAYLLFPLLIALMFRALVVVTAVWTGLGVAFLIGMSRLDPAGGLAVRWAPLDFGRCVVEFGFGMLVYRAYRRPSWLHAVAADRWTWGFAAAACAALMLRNDLLAVLFFPPLVLAFALNKGQAGRALSHPVLHYIGVISFSIYLVHHMFRVPLFWAVRQWHPAPLSAATALGSALVGSLLVLPVAALAYRAVERPGRDAMNGALRRINPRLLRSPPVRPAD